MFLKDIQMPGFTFQPQNNFFNSQLQTQASFQSPRAAGLITNGGTCDDRLGQLVGDIFIGHEVSIVITILQVSIARSIILSVYLVGMKILISVVLDDTPGSRFPSRTSFRIDLSHNTNLSRNEGYYRCYSLQSNDALACRTGGLLHHHYI